MPWWVTQSMARSAWRRSSDRRRTVCTPGSTSVPLPVMILNPRLSWSSAAAGLPDLMPEMMSASLGSATRHMSLRSHGGDHDGARREMVDHHDAGTGGDDVVAVGGVGVVGLGAAPHGDH